MDSKLTAFVTYAQPSFEELELRFREFNRWEFEPLELYKDISREDREITCEVLTLEEDLELADLLNLLTARGVRGLFYEELLCFIEKEEVKTSDIRWFVALGSRAVIEKAASLLFPTVWFNPFGLKELVLTEDEVGNYDQVWNENIGDYDQGEYHEFWRKGQRILVTPL